MSNPYEPLSISHDLQMIFPNDNGIWGLRSLAAGKFIPIPLDEKIIRGLLLAIALLYERAFDRKVTITF